MGTTVTFRAEILAEDGSEVQRGGFAADLAEAPDKGRGAGVRIAGASLAGAAVAVHPGLTMRVLVTRPQPGASATAARLAALGHEAVVVPLLTLRACDWTPPETLPDALLFTSANAVRLGGPELATLAAVPVIAVGSATAAAVRAAGFTVALTGDGGIAELIPQIAAAGFGRILHLAGAERIDAGWPPGVDIDRRTVYAANGAASLPESVCQLLAGGAPDAPLVLLYSPRTAAIFAALCERHALPRGGIVIAAISAAATAAAGTGWRAVATAPSPSEAALFAAAGLTSAADGVEGGDGAAD